MKVYFNKPTHETDGKYWINLSVEKIREAKKRKEMIEVVLPQGECHPVSPERLLKYGVKTQAVYLYPDKPMKLIGAYYGLKTEADKLKEFSEQCL